MKNIKKKSNNTKISVIMPVYLGNYDNCATNREQLFIRAVNSFISQSYENKELVVISDGCKVSEKIYNEKFSKYPFIIFKRIPKKKTFSGLVRNKGLKLATGKIICYLDSDDYLGKNHLSTVVSSFTKEIDWIYYNDMFNLPNGQIIPKSVKLEHNSIGTSSIAHRNKILISWRGCNGYGHDWKFVQRLMKYYKSSKKIYGAEYYICHIPNIFG